MCDINIIEINAKANPPILKIYDYTKYIWELKQIEKKKKKNVKILDQLQFLNL